MAQVDKLVFRLLKVADSTQLPLGELIVAYPEALRPRLLDYLRHLGKRALLEFQVPGVPKEVERPLRQVALPVGRYLPTEEELPSVLQLGDGQSGARRVGEAEAVG